MDNKPLDWKKLKSETNPKVVETGGADSVVYQVSKDNLNTVAKHYKKLSRKLGVELTKEILLNYYADTERAQELLQKNPNPLNQSVIIDEKIYPLYYIVIPQGGVMMDSDELEYKRNKFDFDSKLENSPVVLSQSFVGGLNLQNLRLNLRDMFYGISPEVRNQQEVFRDDINLNHDIENKFRELIGFYLNDKLNVHFSEHSMNIKPFLNNQKQRVEIIITDLAGVLDTYFYDSERLKPIRFNRNRDSNK